MKTQCLIFIAAALLLSACQKPTEVQLVNDQSDLEVVAVDNPDSTYQRAGVDSTGLLPADIDKYSGFITLTDTKSDYGAGITRKSSALVLFQNKRRVIVDSNGLRHYFAIPLQYVKLNGDTLDQRQLFVGNQPAGFEYFRNVNFISPRSLYTFRGGGDGDSIGPFLLVIEAPEALTMLSPAGGARFAKNKNIDLRWTGQGDFWFVISSLATSGGHSTVTPLFSVHVKKNLGYATLGKEILNALPRGQYVLTCYIVNRDERSTLGRFQSLVLIQASSICNVLVNLI